MTDRLMPNQLDFGRSFDGCMGEPMLHRENFSKDYKEDGRRVVMGFYLPEWQRGLVWTQEQKVKLIESCWLGINIGTYTFNRADFESPYDNLLIDGQQRMNAIQCYLDDEFPVFGYRWSETTETDKRCWRIRLHFRAFITESKDEAYLRNYYNLMNFAGTAHKEDERA